MPSSASGAPATAPPPSPGALAPAEFECEDALDDCPYPDGDCAVHSAARQPAAPDPNRPPATIEEALELARSVRGTRTPGNRTAAAVAMLADYVARDLLSDSPRPGRPTVTIEVNVDTSWSGCAATEQHDVDAEWWDGLSDDERDDYLRGTAVEVLGQYASSGASVVARSDEQGGA